MFQVGAGDELFERIAFPSRTVGYAASRQALYKTEDGGKTWRRIREAKEARRVHCLHFWDDRTGWLGADRLEHTTDGGATWSPLPLPEVMQTVSGLALAPGPDGWMLAGGTARAEDGSLALFRKRDAQAAWEKLDPAQTGYWGGAGQPHRRWFLGGLVIGGPRAALAAVFKGYEAQSALLRTADGGNTWAPVLTSPDKDLYRVQLADGRHGWLTGSDGSFWMTADGGLTWQPQPNPEPEGGTPTCLAFAPGASAFGLAPLWKGKVLMMTTGQTWHPVQVQLGYSMPSAVVVDPGCAYVLGTDGRIAHYVDPRVEPAK
jgi:photosystem II stability/assembly factor-like uncharacterized protein